MNKNYKQPITIGNAPIVGETAREQAESVYARCKQLLEPMQERQQSVRIYAPELSNRVRDLVVELFLKDNWSARYFRNRQYKRTPYFIFTKVAAA
ncbi:MAG: hypothetical protein HY986_09520 [Candidatus Melainabacteria bacterium]|nr:hypothetical protein [Candidatus Melainabacteria bacterium]